MKHALVALFCSLSAISAVSAQEEAKPDQFEEFEVRIQTNADKLTATVQLKRDGKWTTVHTHKLDAIAGGFGGESIVVPYVKGDHDQFFPEELRGKTDKTTVAVLVIIQQHHEAGFSINPVKRQIEGVVMCVHSYQFVMTADGKILMESSSGSRTIRELPKPVPLPAKPVRDTEQV